MYQPIVRKNTGANIIEVQNCQSEINKEDIMKQNTRIYNMTINCEK